jgi:hypothetical protein
MKTYTGKIEKLGPDQILVGGTNWEGKHGSGLAKLGVDIAGAISGQAMGLQGQFYGIVTKDLSKKSHPSVNESIIVSQIEILYYFAQYVMPEKEFIIGYSAEGPYRSGFTASKLASFFATAAWGTPETIPSNIIFEEEFSKLVDCDRE